MLIYSFVSLGIFLYNGVANSQTSAAPSESLDEDLLQIRLLYLFEL